MSIEFSCTTPDGKPIVIATQLLDELVEIVNGKRKSDKRALAVDLLRYVSQQQAASKSKSELDRAVDQMILNTHLSALFETNDYRLETVKDQDGIERLEMKKVSPVEVEEI